MNKNKPSLENTLFCYGFYQKSSIFQGRAKIVHYPFFEWKGLIYKTSSGRLTKFTKQDLVKNKIK